MAGRYWPGLQCIDYNSFYDTPHQVERYGGDGFIHEAANVRSAGYVSDSIIVAIDGKFVHERFAYPGPRVSFAVFVGPYNKFNQTAQVPPKEGTFATSIRGELTAAIHALKVIQEIMCSVFNGSDGPLLRRVIIKSDSEYLVKGITERIYTWMDNGWINSRNSRVTNWDLWELLLMHLDHVQSLGLEVLFWQVPWGYNREAGIGAHIALKIMR